MPLIASIDYIITPGGGSLSSTIVLADNISSPTVIFSLDTTQFKSAVLEYSIVRGTKVRTGHISMASNGATISFTDDFIDTDSTGITFSGTLTGSNMEIRYISSSMGIPGSFRYLVRKLTS